MTLFPSTCSNSFIIGGTDWVNPSSGTVEDGNSARETSSISNYLYCSGYGFSLPVNATVIGIMASFKKYADSGKSAIDNSVKLFENASSVGNDKGTSTVNWVDTGPTWYDYGSSTDTWGVSLTPTDVNASLFGAGLSGQKNAGGVNPFNLDVEKMTVFYSVPDSINGGTIYNGTIR